MVTYLFVCLWNFRFGSWIPQRNCERALHAGRREARAKQSHRAARTRYGTWYVYQVRRLPLSHVGRNKSDGSSHILASWSHSIRTVETGMHYSSTYRYFVQYEQYNHFDVSRIIRKDFIAFEKPSLVSRRSDKHHSMIMFILLWFCKAIETTVIVKR